MLPTMCPPQGKNHSPLLAFMEKGLAELKHKGLYRKLGAEGAGPASRQLKDFCSNDYLSLQFHKGIRKGLMSFLKGTVTPSPRTKGDAGRMNAPGSLSGGSSPLIRGYSLWHQMAEKKFQKLTGHPSLFFNSGYMANVGVMTTVGGVGTCVFSDRLNHASLIDGCRLSRAEVQVYEHNNPSHLQSLLKKSRAKKKVIVTESLFSMDGDFAPLRELARLAERYQALLVVDEAHATGLYGPGGAGLSYPLKGPPVIRIHPCGKALSASGAFVCAPVGVKNYLINRCRTFIYSTASPPINMHHICCVLNALENEPERREVVKNKALWFTNTLKGFCPVTPSTSPIVPVLVKGNQKALKLASFLRRGGYDVRAIRFPTVPKSQERLRVCIHYNHSMKDLKALAALLARGLGRV